VVGDYEDACVVRDGGYDGEDICDIYIGYDSDDIYDGTLCRYIDTGGIGDVS